MALAELLQCRDKLLRDEELRSDPSKHFRLGPPMIRRKSKDWRRACQLLLPVRKLAVQLARFQPFPLPGCKVYVLNTERRKGRLTASRVGRINLDHFLPQYSHGPAVRDEVMRGE